MKTLGLTLLNLVYVSYLVIISIVYELISLFYVPWYVLSGRGQWDDAFRVHNWAYGRFVVKASWPYLRIRVHGAQNIPVKPPYVFVFNHRSFLDIFFSAMVPVGNQLVIVRSWVFGLKIFGWAMHLAKYLNIDKTTVEECVLPVLSRGSPFKRRQAPAFQDRRFLNSDRKQSSGCTSMHDRHQ